MKDYAWAIVEPDGSVRADSNWESEQDAWFCCADIVRVDDGGVDWIEKAKADGWRALRVRIFEVGPA